jgi:anaerobic ribonucleoside-triphosphate reductase
MVYVVKIHDLHHLEQRFMAICEQISPDTLLRVHSNWEKRLHTCISQHGEHVEHIV